ncbi:MAG TPA: septal ring lytic transglycosylase RlpA family protein [Caulobacteraceae bacterium]|jgi:rare lipoprotein A
MAVRRLEQGSGSARVARASLVLALGGLGLAACATAPSRTGLTAATSDDRSAPPRGGGYGSGLHGTDKPYEINGNWYYPHAQPDYDVTGYASWYGQAFHNKRTADGEIFDQFGLSAAHKTLPLPSMVDVTNLDNGKTLRLRLNDRGPFVGDRVLDVSRAAAEQLGFARQGLTRVRVRYVGPAPAFSTPVTYAAADPAPSVAAPRSMTDAPSPWRRPQGVVQAQALPQIAPVSPAPTPAPVVAAPQLDAPTQLAASDTSRFAEASVAWSPTPAKAAPYQAPAGMAPIPDPVDAGPMDTRPVALAPPPRPVEMATLAPQPEPALPAPMTAPASAAPGDGYSVQAGAFSSRDNAERAAAQLGDSATIRPLARGDTTLYRVVLAGYPDAAAAEAAKARAVAAGFADARVVSAY